MINALYDAVQALPEQVNGYRSQSDRQKRKRATERSIFRDLLSKLAGTDSEDQMKFLVDQAKKISRNTYVKLTLDSFKLPPDFATLPKANRKTYRPIHQLIDTILPIAAGSPTPESQINLFKVRRK